MKKDHKAESTIKETGRKLRFLARNCNIDNPEDVRGFLANKKGKNGYIATAAVISLAVDITRIPVYFGSGFLQPQFYYYIPLLFLLAISGSFTGKKIVSKISQPTFRKIVLVVISLVSLKFVYDGVIYLI